MAHSARSPRTAPSNAYRLVSGAALVAGPDGQGPVKQHAWKTANPWPTSRPDFMINVAGLPVEETRYNRCARAFEFIGEERQQELLAIFEQAGGTSDPHMFIRDALYDNENIPLAAALNREGLLDDEGNLNRDFEHYVLHRQFPKFFDQRPAANGSPARTHFTSDAGRAFRTLVVNGGKKNLTPEDCSPWAVLRAAGVITVMRDDVTAEQRYNL